MIVLVQGITPWQEVQFLLRAFYEHGVWLKIWEIAEYCYRQEQAKDPASSLAPHLFGGDETAIQGHPMQCLFTY